MTSGAGQIAYSCKEPDARLMISLDLSRCGSASLSFGSGWDLPRGSSMALRLDGTALWKASGKADWNRSEIGLDRFCGRTVVLDFAPGGWRTGASFLLFGLQLRTDRETRPLTTYEEVSSHGWTLGQNSPGIGFFAGGGSVDIRDTDIQTYSYSTTLGLDNSTLMMSGVPT